MKSVEGNSAIAIKAILLLAVAVVPVAQPAAAAAKNLIKNGGFEEPSLTALPPPHFGKHAEVDLPYFAEPVGKSVSWLYATTSGIINTTSTPNPWFPDSAPPSGYAGLQFALIQGAGSISQSFKVKQSGIYTVTWADAGRPASGAYDGDETYELEVNGVNEGIFQTTSSQNFTPETVQVTLAPGSNVIAFVGMPNDNGDHTAFLDSVSITFGQ